MDGIHWYKKVYNFLSSQKCYLIITQSEQQKLSLIDIINSHKGKGLRLKAENKKYGIYVSRGRRGNAAVVTQDIANEFCETNNIDIRFSKSYIFEYTAKMFLECHRLKNINVHKNRKIPKNISYNEQLETKEWKDYRNVVFANRGRTCEMCGAKTNLQVHHIKYVFGRKAWEYPIKDVMVLCRNCHKKIHNIV